MITTVPFGEVDPASLVLLDVAGIEYVINPIGRRPTEDELVSLVPGFDVLIAGTEPITERVMEAALQLRLISRPVVLTMRPSCSAIVGSISSLRWVFCRVIVPSSSTSISRE